LEVGDGWHFGEKIPTTGQHGELESISVNLKSENIAKIQRSMLYFEVWNRH
jgi:hypothetical protein